MPTEQNLAAAFAGESQASRRYVAFAKKAESEGFPQIARLFRAAAEAETVHAAAHLRVMNGIKTTKENVSAAIEGEGYEFKSMYPAFIKDAEAEGQRAAIKSFENAMAVEKIHYSLYQAAFDALTSGKDLSEARIFVCPVCGNTEIGFAPERCPICNVAGERFIEVK